MPTSTTPPLPPDASLVNDGHGNCYALVGGQQVYAPRCPESLLEAPPADRLVFTWSDRCQRVPDGVTVRCPPGGPTALLPDPTSIRRGDEHVSLRIGDLTCLHGHDTPCAPGVNCNPPPPESVPCPPELLPRLAPGVKPTKSNGGRCWFDAVEVVCPKT